jgi:hypothetical protein
MQIKKYIDGRIPSNHPDLELLAKNCECDNYLSEASGTHADYQYQGNYFRVTFLKYWSRNSIEGLKNSFEKTNKQTSEYQFELLFVDDFESDDDRYWDATFTFLSHKK